MHLSQSVCNVRGNVAAFAVFILLALLAVLAPLVLLLLRLLRLLLAAAEHSVCLGEEIRVTCINVSAARSSFSSKRKSFF